MSSSPRQFEQIDRLFTDTAPPRLARLLADPGAQRVTCEATS